MKEHPIIFTTESVKAILDGRKTMTRRVIKNPRRTPASNPISSLSAHSRVYSMGDIERELELAKDMKPNFTCPYGQAGDRLWVRATWAKNFKGQMLFKYQKDRLTELLDLPEIDIKWKPSIHLHKEDAEIWLEITEVRVERVQEISDRDCIAEGCPHALITLPTVPMQSWYKHLWDSLNAKRGYSWETNPWVWVISFKRIIKHSPENVRR